MLRLLAACTTLGVRLSRMATDLQLWSTGRGGAPLGAFSAAAMAMHTTPFSNSVSVGTEGVKPLWHALHELTEAVILARLVVAGAEPQPEKMLRRAVEGFPPATELANRLVLGTGISFRSAHHRVGALVTGASERGEPLASSAGHPFREHVLAADAARMDPRR